MAKSTYFKKHLQHDGYVPIGNVSVNMFKINILGNIVNANGIPVPHSIGPDGKHYVEIRLKTYGNILKEFEVSHLVLHTFKPTNLSVDYWYRLNVLYVDGDFNNLHPENLVWSWTKLMHHIFSDFAIIPGATKQGISKNGEIIVFKTGNILSNYISDDYICTSITPDVGERFKARVHRLKCLAWTDYPANVDEMEVNHIDGDKTNNDFSNLEWVTHIGNLEHALANGLDNKHSKTVSVREIFLTKDGVETLAEWEYPSFVACEVDWKVHANSISRRARHQSDWLFIHPLIDKTTDTKIHGVQFKSSAIKEWPEITKKNTYRNSQIVQAIKCKDHVSGEVSIFKNIEMVSKITGIEQTILEHLLKYAEDRYYVKQYEFKFAWDLSDWSVPLKNQLDIMKELASGAKFTLNGKGKIVTDILTGERRIFMNSGDCGNFFDRNAQWTIKKSNQKVPYLKRWKIETVSMKIIE